LTIVLFLELAPHAGASLLENCVVNFRFANKFRPYATYWRFKNKTSQWPVSLLAPYIRVPHVQEQATKFRYIDLRRQVTAYAFFY